MDEGSEILKQIQRTLDEIKSILVITKQSELEQIKTRLLHKDSMKERIYNHCDGSNTTKTIAVAVAKDEGYVRANLSVLRREGLVRTVDRDGNQVHEQVF